MNGLKKSTINRLKVILKITVSAGAIYYLSTKLDLKSILTALSQAKISWLLVAVSLYTLSQIFAAFRLNTLFKAIPIKISQWVNIKLYWLGLFYNLFLPGGIGGDGFKIFLINKHFKTPVKRLIGISLTDRLSGLSVIMIYILSLVYFIEYELPYQGWFWILIPFTLIGYFLFVYIFNKSLISKYLKVTGWSILIQGLQLLVVIAILESMGAGNSNQRDDYLFLFLVSSITASIPTTLGGIGFRELTFQMGAEYLGLNEVHAVAVSLLFYFSSVITAFPGLVYTLKPENLFIQRHKKRS